MNENLNLVEILKDCPKGTKLYSTLHGEVTLIRTDFEEYYPILVKLCDNLEESFTAEGKLIFFYDGECILFPSKDQRDWSKFTAPWYKKEMDTNSISNKDDERLRKTAIAFLKDFAEQGYENAVECIDWLEKQGDLSQTKHLVGTNDEAPEYL